jgi:hypothetical protein
MITASGWRYGTYMMKAIKIFMGHSYPWKITLTVCDAYGRRYWNLLEFFKLLL